MISSIPILESFGIDAKTGFLPSAPPLTKLTNSHFAPWESTVKCLGGRLIAGALRHHMDMVC